MEFIIDNEVIKGHDKYLLIMNLISNPGVDVSVSYTHLDVYKRQVLLSSLESAGAPW